MRSNRQQHRAIDTIGVQGRRKISRLTLQARRVHGAHGRVVLTGGAANDPFINHVKEIGRGDELSVSISHGNRGDKSRGTTGRGHLIPSVYQEKSSWYTPYAERMKQDPEATFAQSHGSNTFWSVYTNLWRNP